MRPTLTYIRPEARLIAANIAKLKELLKKGLNARLQLLPVMNADDLKKGLDIARQAM